MQFDHYTTFIDYVLEMGHVAESRYGDTKESLSCGFAFQAGTMVHRPNFNSRLAWMELMQFLGGVFDLEEIRKAAPKAKAELFTAQMAYGPRIVGQVQTLVNALKDDLDMRQAVLFIAKPLDGPTSKLPCTLSIQFIVRDYALHSIVSMRSWDLIRGLPYDIILFGGITKVMAHLVNMKAGMVYVNAGSAHIYESDQHMLPGQEKRKSFSLSISNLKTWDEITLEAHRNVYNTWTNDRPHLIDSVTDWIIY